MEHVLVTWSLDEGVIPLPAASHPLWDVCSDTYSFSPWGPGLPNLCLPVSQQLLLPSTSSGGLGVGVGVGRVRARWWMPHGASRWGMVVTVPAPACGHLEGALTR